MSVAANIHEHHAQMTTSPHSLMADIDAALMEQIFNSSKGQRETDLQHHRQADDLAACFEKAKWLRFGHVPMLQIRPARFKLISSDSTRGFVLKYLKGHRVVMVGR